MGVIVVFLGGGLGSVLRYLISLIFTRHGLNSTFPWHTLAINVSGSFLIGLVVSWFALRSGLTAGAANASSWQLFLATGLLGGFTTFSTFALESIQLVQRGQLLLAIAYITSSILLSMLAVVLAFTLLR